MEYNIKYVLLIFLCTTVITIITATNTDEFSFKLFAFLVPMLLFIFTNDINFIYQFFGRIESFKQRVLDCILWIFCGEIFLLFFVVIFETYFTLMKFDKNFSTIFAFLGTCSLYLFMKKVIHLKSEILKFYYDIKNKKNMNCNRLKYCKTLHRNNIF